MSIDGFHEGHKHVDAVSSPRLAAHARSAVLRLADWLHVDLVGIEKLPPGRGLLVGNHAFGVDAVFPATMIAERTGRRVSILGEHAWWHVPFVRRLAHALSVVDGTQENLSTILERDELALVLPGGLREAIKPRRLRYQLLWGHRYGFVRAALRARAPLVPIACIGADELFDFVGHAYERGPWLWRDPWELGALPGHMLTVPPKVHLSYHIGEPIPCPGGPDAADDFELVHRLRYELEGTLYALIARGRGACARGEFS